MGQPSFGILFSDYLQISMYCILIPTSWIFVQKMCDFHNIVTRNRFILAWNFYETIILNLISVQCKPGYHGTYGKCHPCGRGYFSSKSGMTSCTKCPNGKETQQLASVAFYECIWNSMLMCKWCIKYWFWVDCTIEIKSFRK